MALSVVFQLPNYQTEVCTLRNRRTKGVVTKVHVRKDNDLKGNRVNCVNSFMLAQAKPKQLWFLMIFERVEVEGFEPSGVSFGDPASTLPPPLVMVRETGFAPARSLLREPHPIPNRARLLIPPLSPIGVILLLPM